jgi:hypothetical protein
MKISHLNILNVFLWAFIFFVVLSVDNLIVLKAIGLVTVLYIIFRSIMSLDQELKQNG